MPTMTPQAQPASVPPEPERKTRATGGVRPPRRGPNAEWTVRGVWYLTIGLLLLYPTFELFRRSFRAPEGGFTFDNYASLLSDPLLLESLRNSAFIAVGSVFGATLIGVPLAYLVARTDLPGKGFFRGIVVLTFAAPSFIAAFGWILLLGRNGLINKALMDVFGLEEPPINIFTPWGIIFVLTTFLYPLIFLPVASAFSNMDSSLEQAAASLGASRWRVARSITLPLLLPAYFGGAMLVFVTGFVIFGPVAVLGAPANFQTVPMVLLNLISAPPRIEAAAVMTIPVLAIIVAVLVLQRWLLGRRRFTVTGGKAGPRSQVRLGIWKIPAFLFALSVLVVTLVLPFGILALTSFRRAIGLPLGRDNLVLTDNYERVLDNPQIVTSFTNSFLTASSASLGAIAIAVAAVWLVQRTHSRANRPVVPLMLVSLAFPGAVLAIGLVIAFARPPFAMGGTLAILIVAYTVSALPLAFAYINAAMSQVGPELEEASRGLGAGVLRTWWKITLPLIRTTLVAVGLLCFVLLFRELEMSVFLYTGANPTVATILYELAGESLFQLVGALSVLVLLVNIVVVIAAIRLLRDDSGPTLT